MSYFIQVLILKKKDIMKMFQQASKTSQTISACANETVVGNNECKKITNTSFTLILHYFPLWREIHYIFPVVPLQSIQVHVYDI